MKKKIDILHFKVNLIEKGERTDKLLDHYHA